ncbi:MAG: phosphatidylserine decarboxylase family protein [Flavobacteriaceae bacterium]|nr:phosphatidylserine decarboxylase family protein [Flavobacteriaceae bacterium]
MFHKEGIFIIVTSFIIISILIIINDQFNYNLKTLVNIFLMLILILIFQFFRNPKIKVNFDENYLLSPADGKIVIIEEVNEPEFFKDKRLQVSIFMSPINVHVTRYPMNGKIIFSKYHPGKYLVAWHPKSSTKNERTTIVLENEKFGKILYRQIAGKIARRIINYAKVGDQAIQGEDAGFIKFGSRIDLFLPLNSKINVKLDQVVKGGQTIIYSKKN